MKLKSLLFVGVLAIFTLSVAIAKSYDISFSSATKVGSLQLKAGSYSMKVDGNKATFTDTTTYKSVTTDVKVESGDSKFDQTKVNASTDSGTTVVKDIELGGTKTKLGF